MIKSNLAIYSPIPSGLSTSGTCVLPVLATEKCHKALSGSNVLSGPLEECQQEGRRVSLPTEAGKSAGKEGEGEVGWGGCNVGLGPYHMCIWK